MKSPYDIIIRPLVTEKSNIASKNNNTYFFAVQPDANKPEIKKAVEKADKPGAKFIDHEEVEAWLKTWGTKKERKPPKCV